ncbi:MAG TPA: M20/M25/M40 family metallo-hydrolase [Candidatus Absconditabacterales bacterium]|nr:M20/M25/M40 family metallo-hydrolase [Candidatus Absconditabacterales bacterium]
MIAEYYIHLKEYLSFKSISTDGNFNNEIQTCSNRLKELFEQNNFQVEVVSNYGNPIIIASYFVDNNLENGLIYGHYDVQNANQIDGRKENPFNLYIGKDKVIGRGVVDNKGQTLIHILSIIKLIKENKLGYNITFILEGEEEIGSPGIIKFIEENKQKFKADFILISDGNIVKNLPIIESGFRGGFNSKLEIKTANTDLHTGIYGGIVPNPIEELINLFSKLYDANNQVTIPYFYYEVEEFNVNQKILNSKIPFNQEDLTNFGISQTKLKDVDFYTKSGWLPCIEITGINSGSTEFFKNSIPNTATANINFRLVNNQKCDSIVNLFKEWIKNNLPKNIEYKLSFDQYSKPTKISLQNKFVDKAEKTLTEIYANKVIYLRSGGSLPIIDIFQTHVSNNILSIPLANEDSNMHGVNENFEIDLIKKGLEFSYKFFQK